MARLSKAKYFEIYDDSRASNSGSIPATTDKSTMSLRGTQRLARPELERQDSKFDAYADKDLYDHADDEDPNFLTVNEEEDADDERRESTFTSTSISTMPDSAVQTDNELPFSMHRPYTPPSVRPTFRRAESVRRMQMTSPTPFDRSPRRSLLSRSRPGTPRSARSAAKSPKVKKQRIEEEDEEDERQDYPLVLLHLTLLPVELPWSAESMQELLPPRIPDNLQLLRVKVSETILQRGILIPHPKEDYDLLEERLLEALELKTERVTKCGHFRAQGSMSTISSLDGSVDSGHGSSLEGSENEVCLTCYHRVKLQKLGVGSTGQKWTVKVFAANGLMRAAAWGAAWPEMERVDVEIIPWISDDLRKLLDARAAEEEEERRRGEAETGFVRTAGELTWIADEDMIESHPPVEQQVLQTLQASHAEELLSRLAAASAQYPAASTFTPDTHGRRTEKRLSELPQVWRPSEIPISLILRNYIFLLAQDARNVAILALTLVALWLSIQSAFKSSPNNTLAPTLELCPAIDPSDSLFNSTLELFNSTDTATPNTSKSKPSLGTDAEQQLEPISTNDNRGSPTAAQSEHIHSDEL